MVDLLMSELEALLNACRQRDVTVFVIGGFGVRAYGSLLRRTLDLDLAVAATAWPALADVLGTQGYRLSSSGIWVTATKNEGAEAIEIHIAVGDVVDIQSAARYPVGIEPGDWRSLPETSLSLPVFTLEGLLITKLMALRDNDVVDVVALLLQHAGQMDTGRFWKQAGGAGLKALLEERLADLAEILHSEEVNAIWWDRLGLMLDEGERQLALASVRQLWMAAHAGRWRNKPEHD
ncbi:MAG: hypothetical protein FJ011_22325 [Chloroflexi bacterium]|nr:hypothetical protein [Chloroflexota bacterium]